MKQESKNPTPSRVGVARTVLFICIVVALTLPSAFGRTPEWKPYDDFEGDLDANERPWADTRSRHEMGTLRPGKTLRDGHQGWHFWDDVKAPGGRDPGFKLVFGWDPSDILGIQFHCEGCGTL